MKNSGVNPEFFYVVKNFDLIYVAVSILKLRLIYSSGLLLLNYWQ